jgi:hypothetical protein
LWICGSRLVALSLPGTLLWIQNNLHDKSTKLIVATSSKVAPLLIKCAPKKTQNTPTVAKVLLPSTFIANSNAQILSDFMQKSCGSCCSILARIDYPIFPCYFRDRSSHFAKDSNENITTHFVGCRCMERSSPHHLLWVSGGIVFHSDD